MDTQIGYGQLRYAVWTVSYSNQIPSGYAQNRIWADSLNEAFSVPANIYKEGFVISLHIQNGKREQFCCYECNY